MTRTLPEMEPHKGRREADRAFTQPGDTTFSFQLAKSRHSTMPVCPSDWRNGHVLTAGIRMYKKCRGRWSLYQTEARLTIDLEASQHPRSCWGCCVFLRQSQADQRGFQCSQCLSQPVLKNPVLYEGVESPGARASLGILAEKWLP